MSILPDWTDLLPTFDAIHSMAHERLAQANTAVEQITITLGYGIAAISNLLACTASNGETGQNDKTAAYIGWLPESLGALSVQLANTSNAVNAHRRTAPALGE